MSDLWRQGLIGKTAVIALGGVLSCVCLASVAVLTPSRSTPTPNVRNLGDVTTATVVITRAATATTRPTMTPTDMPTSTATDVPATPTLRPAMPTVILATRQSNPNAFQCVGGCSTPPAGCTIKGNVNSKGDRIYHTTASRDYDVTKVKLEEGDRWFCTEEEAKAAGFRAPLR